MTKFLDDHPGGDEVILTATGNIEIFLGSCLPHSDTVYV